MSATQQQHSAPVAEEQAGAHEQAAGPDLRGASSTEQSGADMATAAEGTSGGTLARLRQNFNAAGVSLFLQILGVGQLGGWVDGWAGHGRGGAFCISVQGTS
jgi:hypothetical protein